MSAAVSDRVTLVFRGVRAIDPALGLDATCDVVVEDGVVQAVGAGAGDALVGSERARVIDGTGRWLVPAFVDLHAHLREPGQEYKEDIASGLAAAAAGGYAHVCVMPNTRPVNDTRAVTELMLARAREVHGPTLHPIGAITVGQKGAQLTEMGDLREAGAVAVSDDGVCVMNAQVMRRALEYASHFGMPVIQHAEDHDLTSGAVMHEGAVSARLGLRGWPRVAEDIIIARDILLAEYTKSRYHAAHISTLGAVRLMREAKARGLEVTCEVTPHHLLLTDASVIGYDTYCKVNPPLREEQDVEALVTALADGTLDAIATDHAPHSPLEKECEFDAAAPGLMGLELCFGLLLELVHAGRVPLTRLLHALSTGPARIIGLAPPSLRLGARAELCLVDPELAWSPGQVTLHTKHKNTPFMDRVIRGKVLLTLARGEVVFDAVARGGSES
ncbi:MAG: dihydroorotase [Polyangiaceae bacterium]|nr:dihydroorotase [Polyangiaceae bacterium]MCW5791496.1 dihydroorotase [Polyangiaceae bacterium]